MPTRSANWLTKSIAFLRRRRWTVGRFSELAAPIRCDFGEIADGWQIFEGHHARLLHYLCMKCGGPHAI